MVKLNGNKQTSQIGRNTITIEYTGTGMLKNHTTKFEQDFTKCVATGINRLRNGQLWLPSGTSFAFKA